MKLADVLWEAANRHLSVNGYNYNDGKWCSYYSCVAVRERLMAMHLKEAQADKSLDSAMRFLRALGCPTNSSAQTFRTSDPLERQQRRYMWLLLAMHVAEDEGIEL